MTPQNIKNTAAAIQFIETHISEKMNLDKIASALNYSKHHLHRSFTNTTGFTIHEYVQRRKLSLAAKQLISTSKTILEIALIAGYESQQAFTNAFKSMYKIPPNAFRENRKYYPLQLELSIDSRPDTCALEEKEDLSVEYASVKDIPVWMDVVRMVIDGFPHLYEDEYLHVLKKKIKSKEALIMKQYNTAIGILLFSKENSSIDFMGIHPLYRKDHIFKTLLHAVSEIHLKGRAISITTFRQGDKADTGHRDMIQKLGFKEAELLVEFGYPTQRFILDRSDKTPESTTDFPDEHQHLNETLMKIDTALQDATESVLRKNDEYMTLKRYMVDNRGEIDPHEMFQNELALKEIDRSGAFLTTVRDKLAKLKNTPYFSRIDFQETGSVIQVPIYIGLSSFSFEDEILISDWRAPIASLFYDYEIGPAEYTAPSGHITGQLTRKRQFKITEGQLEYAFETSVNIQDDILQKELSHTSDEKMKSIIATIQKDQNKIIRNEKSKTMIIQGVAGSGKTSIALHRIAFLLYRFKDTLSSKNIMIVSPNKVFGDYISSVLPDLGEDPLLQFDFFDIAKTYLDGIIGFESEKDPFSINDDQQVQRVRYKSSLSFLQELNAFINQISNTVFTPVDYAFGDFKMSAEQIQARFNAYHKHPVKKRLKMVADDIYNRFDSDNYMDDPLPKRSHILKALNKMLTVKNTMTLYKAFYKHINRSNLFVLAAKKTLEWSDVFPFLYLHAAFCGLDENRIIKHIVIDEMQDYTPTQYAVINKLFNCQKTVLGDFGQFINPYQTHSLKDILEVYEQADFIELTKSYRSTYEIISFAKQFKVNGTIEAIKRHGEKPQLIPCYGEKEETSCIESEIDHFMRTEYASLGIIVKTNSDALTLYKELSQAFDVHLISPESTTFRNGVSITSIQMSKGLEFDAVFIPQVNAKNYSTPYDANLLYIACTRAMHQLTLSYYGEVSPLLTPNFTS